MKLVLQIGAGIVVGALALSVGSFALNGISGWMAEQDAAAQLKRMEAETAREKELCSDYSLSEAERKEACRFFLKYSNELTEYRLNRLSEITEKYQRP